MAGEEAESFIQKMTREKTLALRAVGGRVFIENASPEKLDRSMIELKCWWSPSFLASFDTSLRIGQDKHKPFRWDEDGVEVPDEAADDEVGWSLHDCPIMLSVHRTDDGWLADNENRPNDDPIIGRFSYHSPIQTSDGVVDEKRPTIHAWVALGPENFRLLRDRLTATEALDFDLGIKVEFPRDRSRQDGSKPKYNGTVKARCQLRAPPSSGSGAIGTATRCGTGPCIVDANPWSMTRLESIPNSWTQ